jgi:hypothetical protein
MSGCLPSIRHGAIFSLLVGISVLFGVPHGAFAEEAAPQSDAAAAMVGTWEFSNADHDKICRFVFRADQVANGYKLDIDKNCAVVFPATHDIVAWTVDNFGGLRLLDGAGKAAIELNKAEDGIYDGFDPIQGRYILQSAAAALCSI